ncbi:MAG: CHAT domain-containing protein [Desulfobacterales bacterium]
MKALYLKYHLPSKNLEMGKSYAFVFQLNEQRPEAAYFEIPRMDGLYLHFEGFPGDWIDGKFDAPLNPLEDGFTLPVTVTPPIDAPSGKFSVSVQVRLGVNGAIIAAGFSEEIEIKTQAGAAAVPDPPPASTEELSTVGLAAALNMTMKSLPENCGLLLVCSDGNQLLMSAARGTKDRVKDGEPLSFSNARDLQLDSFVQSTRSYDELKGLGKELFHNLSPAIIAWLNRLVESTPEPPPLLIVDLSGAEIPWEIIYLDPEDDQVDPKGFLGILTAVSRWDFVKIRGRFRDPDILAQEIRQGSMISYISTGDVMHVEPEVEAVRLCGGQPFDRIETLLAALDEKRSDVAFVHIASHGTFDPDDPGAAAIQATDLEIKVKVLDGHDMWLIKQSHPVVFINACHSGRKGRLGWSVCGHQEPFLRYGADGFIGVMGRVRSRAASRVAERLMTEIRRKEVLPVAEILRRIRLEAEEKAAASDENQKHFLDAFMYVFCGSPLKKVRLRSADDGRP